MCKTVKPINFGEAITTNYGRNYFVNQELDCKCGVRRCKYKDITKKLGKGGKNRKNGKNTKRTRDETDSDDEEDGQGGKRARNAAEPTTPPTARKTGPKVKSSSKAAKKGGK